MTKIRCKYLDCQFLDERYCSAAAIELNPDAGCLTYRPVDDDVSITDWDSEELESWDEDEETESLWEVEEEEDELDDDDEEL
ncbi:MAG: hypothetical protein PHW11_01925 [Anaerolineaceae bacterium]|jgi:hypothetical protein|nr:hypothetical protein [Anaerolineaceae bacterium]MDD4041988.1 hypothetical protein [Anaerolineaceae bacterium]MDD4577453.1 hypothetical protein [Anaerolineaceae bacterium]